MSKTDCSLASHRRRSLERTERARLTELASKVGCDDVRSAKRQGSARMQPRAATYVEEAFAVRPSGNRPPQSIDGTPNPGSVDGFAVFLPVLTELKMAVAVL